MLRFHTRVAFLNGRRAEALDLIMPALLGGGPRLNRHYQCFLDHLDHSWDKKDVYCLFISTIGNLFVLRVERISRMGSPPLLEQHSANRF